MSLPKPNIGLNGNESFDFKNAVNFGAFLKKNMED